MSRIKAHDPTKQVAGGDSSRSLPKGGGGKFITLTQAEYTALPTKDPDVVYLIQQ